MRTQVKCAGGRIDFVVFIPNTTYVFKLKVNGTAQEVFVRSRDARPCASTEANSPSFGEGWPKTGGRVSALSDNKKIFSKKIISG